MAKSATTIDEMSGGRFSLGVGSGWMQAEHDAFDLELPALKERFDRLEEALEVITTIVDGGGKVDGTHYSLDAGTVLPKGSDGLGIVVGGGGMKKTPRLAGTYATEYNMFVAEKDSLDQRLDVMRSASEKAGRDSDDILISFAGPAFVYDTEDEHRKALTDRGAKREMSPDEYASFLDARSVPHGTADSAGRAIEQMASWGVGRYYVQEYAPLDDIDLDILDQIVSALQR
jgi:alkanesulfonate monooxygenase SsuD/methylene tetrahydromethanopterin reductase-like flavin-dependent oxidoreductase (luciferase family)